MIEKQKKYNKELNKLPFQFETLNLDLPEANPDKEAVLVNLTELSTEDASMGKDLDDLFSIMHTEALKEFESNDVCIVHKAE